MVKLGHFREKTTCYKLSSFTRSTRHLCTYEVVSFEAPVVVVAAEDDGAKLDPTRKVVVYGSVAEQSGSSYTLRWEQVRCLRLVMARSFDPTR